MGGWVRNAKWGGDGGTDRVGVQHKDVQGLALAPDGVQAALGVQGGVFQGKHTLDADALCVGARGWDREQEACTSDRERERARVCVVEKERKKGQGMKNTKERESAVRCRGKDRQEKKRNTHESERGRERQRERERRREGEREPVWREGETGNENKRRDLVVHQHAVHGHGKVTRLPCGVESAPLFVQPAIPQHLEGKGASDTPLTDSCVMMRGEERG